MSSCVLRLCTGTDVEPVLSKTDLRRRVAAAESESLAGKPNPSHRDLVFYAVHPYMVNAGLR